MYSRKREFLQLKKEFHDSENVRVAKRVNYEPSIYEAFKQRQKISPLNEVFERIQLFQEELSKFDRYEVQVMLHEHFFKVCTRVFFKDLLEKHEKEIRERLLISDFSQEVVVTAPRRFGKSTAVTQFVASLLKCFPGIEIATFSTGSRASGLLMQAVKKALKGTLKLDKSFFLQDAEESLILKFSETDIRKFNAYPGSVDT
jgi:hypothetical protein